MSHHCHASRARLFLAALLALGPFVPAQATVFGVGSLQLTFSGGSCPASGTFNVSAEFEEIGSAATTFDLGISASNPAPGIADLTIDIFLVPENGSAGGLSVSTIRIPGPVLGAGTASVSTTGSLPSIGSINASGSAIDATCTISFVATFSGVAGLFPDPSLAPGSAALGATNETRIIANAPAPFRRHFSHIQRARAGGQSPAASLRPGSGGFQGEAGLNAGSLFGAPVGFWASASYGVTEDDFVTTSFDATRYDVLFGIDLPIQDAFIVGVALGAEHTEADTNFNLGEMDQSGVTIAPYIAAFFGDSIGFDATLGYTYLDIDQFRRAPGTGARVSSSLGARRWFVSVNGRYVRGFGPVVLTGSAGFLYGRSDQDGFTESDGTVIAPFNFKLGQFVLGGEVVYQAGSWEPFAGLNFEHDYTKTSVPFAAVVARPENDRSGATLSLGVRYLGPNGLSGSVEYRTLFGRESFSSDSISGLLRFEFD